MEQLNTLPPSIEPHASGHIIEQIELVKKYWKTDLPMKATAAFISMSKPTIKNTTTENFQAGGLKN